MTLKKAEVKAAGSDTKVQAYVLVAGNEEVLVAVRVCVEHLCREIA